MGSPARILSIDDLHDAQAHDRRDVVVIQAIMNITDSRPMDAWWEMSPGGRTQAIYGEIRRLDLARVSGTSALTEKNIPRIQMARSPRSQITVRG
jgi:hypothetical protein